MIFHQTLLQGAYLLELEKIQDERGFFAKAFCRKEFEGNGLNPDVVQANIGYSRFKGTLRGLHYQIAPHAEVKLVRCTAGAIYDVILDLRPESPSFKQWLGVEMTEDSYRMLYIPEGCAHGYLTLRDHTEVLYQVSMPYAPGAERGVRWNDPCFSIKWPDTEQLVISEKDQSWLDWSAQEPYLFFPS